jgi:transposase
LLFLTKRLVSVVLVQRGKQIGTYVGMIPCEESSARKQRLGHISKQGSSLLRFLLVEAAQAAARIHPDWRRRYMHLAMRRRKSIAKVAMGRRLAVRFVRGTARNRKWREVERRPLDWASRSLQREFELLIMVEVRIEEMFRSD